MSLEFVKNIFFFIGSLLGIVGFINSVIQPLLNDNRQRWTDINNIIDEDLFISLEQSVYGSQMVETELYNDLKKFYLEVEENKNYLNFKFPFRHLFNKHKIKLYKLIGEFKKIVTPPVWDNKLYKSVRVAERINSYELKRKHFREKFENNEDERNAYLEHLNYVTDLVIKMRIEYKIMEVISNLRLFEIIFYRSIIKDATDSLKKRI